MGNHVDNEQIHSRYSPSPQSNNDHSNEDIGPKALQMYQDLMKMGFPDHLSLAAASKFPDDVEEAMDWIMTKEAVDKMEDIEKDPDPPSKPINGNIASQNIQPYQYEEANGYHAENEDDDEDNFNDNVQHQYHDDDKNYFDQNQDEEPMNNNNNNNNQIEPSPEPLQEPDRDSIDKYKEHAPHLSLKNNHSNTISEAISTADIVIKGEYNPDTTPDSMLIISDLISAVLNEDDDGMKLNKDKYPDHMMKPFMRWTNKIKDVSLNKMYYDEICQYLLVDHKRVKNLYAFDKINQVFKNVETIRAYHTGWISKFYLELLLTILDNIHYLEYSKLHKIYLNDINNMGSMDNDIVKYKLLFRQKNWDIQKGVSNIIVERYYG